MPRKPRASRVGRRSRVASLPVRVLRGLPLVGLAVAARVRFAHVLASPAFPETTAPFIPTRVPVGQPAGTAPLVWCGQDRKGRAGSGSPAQQALERAQRVKRAASRATEAARGFRGGIAVEPPPRPSSSTPTATERFSDTNEITQSWRPNPAPVARVTSQSRVLGSDSFSPELGAWTVLRDGSPGPPETASSGPERNG
jgi:hypothetical protein